MMDFTSRWKPWQKALAEKHGLTCPPGWYGFACSAGWESILDRAFSDLRAAGWDGEIHQIKEKFGTMRMYVSDDGRPEFAEIIRRAEDASERTCELCGETEGVTQSATGWIVTRCVAHTKGSGLAVEVAST